MCIVISQLSEAKTEDYKCQVQQHNLEIVLNSTENYVEDTTKMNDQVFELHQ